MDLAELMDTVIEPSAVHVAGEGERLVTMRLADDFSIGMRLHQCDSYRKWDVLEIAVRPTGAHETISDDDVRELPMRALIDEARRLATKSAKPVG
ncbi:hypothetical protein IFT73_05270 [Aeromicrobium sp. CFBP 8757]|uniref:hypothetical protein n=1 Tax=Aeromicrobium sp. CFBP 8757 TaxID=2775288 RepID=UPI001783CD19|nr:hypothetical protein [Aeromicrobium sp. CFBP 8757]MBD8606256.1 hypothetical protein [Aeromicrobium sp. CFBP 8757]